MLISRVRPDIDALYVLIPQTCKLPGCRQLMWGAAKEPVFKCHRCQLSFHRRCLDEDNLPYCNVLDQPVSIYGTTEVTGIHNLQSHKTLRNSQQTKCDVTGKLLEPYTLFWKCQNCNHGPG